MAAKWFNSLDTNSNISLMYIYDDFCFTTYWVIFITMNESIIWTTVRKRSETSWFAWANRSKVFLNFDRNLSDNCLKMIWRAFLTNFCNFYFSFSDNCPKNNLMRLLDSLEQISLRFSWILTDIFLTTVWKTALRLWANCSKFEFWRIFLFFFILTMKISPLGGTVSRRLCVFWWMSFFDKHSENLKRFDEISWCLEQIALRLP